MLVTVVLAVELLDELSWVDDGTSTRSVVSGVETGCGAGSAVDSVVCVTGGSVLTRCGVSRVSDVVEGGGGAT